MRKYEIYSDIEIIQGFIASERVDGKMNDETARELNRLLQEIKDHILLTPPDK